MKDTHPFDIQYFQNGRWQTASIHPCCKEDNIVDYAVWQDGKLLFTITKDMGHSGQWIIALKNADDEFEEEMIQQVGDAIAAKQSR
jgi:hypothetical protein